jgi:putative ABC transport system permease protein
VGTAIAGQTFYLFVVENLRQFGTLKALDASGRVIIGMILVQAMTAGLMGFGLGIGAAALFGMATQSTSRIAFFMPWQVMAGTAVAVLLIAALASILSIRRVLVLEPAVVFKE